MFTKFAIHPQILEAIQKLGFESPTPVQEKTIPHLLEGRDIVGLAETGSGKTAAYLIPALTRVLNNPKEQVLILSPTRELAAQIGTVIRELTPFARTIQSVVLIGGADMHRQLKALKLKPQLMVATPGRLIDLIHRRGLNLGTVTSLILDEADRMFDMGFAPQVNEIVKFLPRQRQTMLFSATFPKEIRGLAERVLVNPVQIEVRKSERPPVVIDQKIIEVSAAQKNDKTLDLINAAKGSVVIFTRTKLRTDRLARYLVDYGVRVAQLHGDRTQAQRIKSITDFKNGVVTVLVATDLAARGLDVPSISDVINYDLPRTTDDYVHRIGRTGRMGQAGQALTLVTDGDWGTWNQIARKMGLKVLARGPAALRGHREPSGDGRRPSGPRKNGRSRFSQNKPKPRGQESSGPQARSKHKGQSRRSFSAF